MWFLKMTYRVLFSWGAYFAWSKLYRAIYHEKFRGTKLDGGLTPEEVAQAMKQLTWTKDGFREVGDAIGSAHWVQHCVNAVQAKLKQPEGSLDCDEFSVWAATVMGVDHAPQVLNVVWREGKSVGGHHVCVYVTEEGLTRHTGNWGDRGPFAGVRRAIVDVLHAMKKSEKDLVGWATFSPTLKLSAWGNSLPPA